jgi:hypothetical protein
MSEIRFPCPEREHLRAHQKCWSEPVLTDNIEFGEELVVDSIEVETRPSLHSAAKLLTAIGEIEATAAGFITSPLPDPLGAHQHRFVGKTALVLDAGHSATNALISLGRLRQQHPTPVLSGGCEAQQTPFGFTVAERPTSYPLAANWKPDCAVSWKTVTSPTSKVFPLQR